MERGDIGAFARLGQACLFEDLLASPPSSVRGRLLERVRVASTNWDSALKLWTPNELPLRSLIDCVDRLGISTMVATLLSEDAVEPIYRWLLRKGVSTSVEYYPSIDALAADLRFNTGIRNVFVPSQDYYSIIGMKATVVSTETPWRV